MIPSCTVTSTEDFKSLLTTELAMFINMCSELSPRHRVITEINQRLHSYLQELSWLQPDMKHKGWLQYFGPLFHLFGSHLIVNKTWLGLDVTMWWLCNHGSTAGRFNTSTINLVTVQDNRKICRRVILWNCVVRHCSLHACRFINTVTTIT